MKKIHISTFVFSLVFCMCAEARYYDPSTGRYIQVDPIGLAGGINPYVYAENNPVMNIDPLGLKTAVVINGTTKKNIFGHTGIATTGNGIYSFGNGTALGSSLTAYLNKQAALRDTEVIIINTTPEQEIEINKYLQNSKDDLPPWLLELIPRSSDSCSTRTDAALSAASLIDPFTIGDSYPTDVLGQAEFWRQMLGGETISIPKGSTSIPTALNEFNPTQPSIPK